MEILNIILAILLIVLAIALIVFVLFQTGGRSNKLSQAISGGSPENYTGKNKQRSKDKKLAKITTVIAIAFAIVVIVFWLLMTYQSKHPKTSTDTTPETTAAEVTDTETDATTEADVTTEADATTEADVTTEADATTEADVTTEAE